MATLCIPMNEWLSRLDYCLAHLLFYSHNALSNSDDYVLVRNFALL